MGGESGIATVEAVCPQVAPAMKEETMIKVIAYLDCGCAMYENGERAVCPTCAAPPMSDRRRFGIPELTHIVNEAIREFDGAGPDCVSDDEVHKFLARVLDELQGVAEMGKSR